MLLTATALFGAEVAQATDGPRTHAIVGATVVVRPGEVLEDATVILRDGRIEEVGPSGRVEVPAEARRHRGESWWVYAGFIESWREWEMPELETPERDGPEEDPGLPGPGSDHVRIHPERRVIDRMAISDKEREALRKGGFTVAAFMPDSGVLRGRAALAHLGDVKPQDAILRAELGVVASLRPERRGLDRYPGSVMGAVAAVRQALLDTAFWLEQDEEDRGYDPVAAALAPVVQGDQPLIFTPRANVLGPRVAAICAEAGIEGVMLATGGEWRRPDLVPAGTGLILPVDFTAKPEVENEADWIQVSLDELRAWDLDPLNPAMLAGAGHEFAFTTHGLERPADLFARLRAARKRGLSEETAVAALTTVPAEMWGMDGFGTVERGGRAFLTVLAGGSLLDDGAAVELVFIDGVPHQIRGKAPKKTDDEAWTRTARFPREDRGPFLAPEAAVVRGATIWTCGPEGVLENADMVVRDGKIVAVGSDLDAPSDALVIDGSGLHVTPGLIDAHSHIAALGGLNESSVSSSAMVRVGDVINSEDRRMYQHLAGGLTTSHILHGSANAIGGQCQAIKLRWGAGPDDLKFAEARPTIKFALGENPKRGNRHTPEAQYRYPQSRIGVDDFIRERFVAALDYQRAFDKGEVPRDLELDALLEILDDERDIHCHSYRQDEILALMRLMEDFGSRVAVFTHILEGYKVADEMARHGAAGSTFSDWWAYKVEVYDAIPYNTTIMDERGVSVSVNSDSADLGRRMNLEAAKSVRYGGTPAERALLFVTRNAADQIGAGEVTGSLESGKHADFVLWNAPPLSTRATARQTWVDGRLYWDAERDLGRQAAIEAERAALIELAIGDDADEEGGSDSGAEPEGRRYLAPAEILWSETELGCNDHVAEGH
jgi:imidazolonepropionase-like amidohydrolase